MNEIEEHTIILYNADKSLNLKVCYWGFSKDQIVKDIQVRFTKRKTRWTQYKFCD